MQKKAQVELGLLVASSVTSAGMIAIRARVSARCSSINLFTPDVFTPDVVAVTGVSGASTFLAVAVHAHAVRGLIV
jgi:hypothetical protein